MLAELKCKSCAAPLIHENNGSIYYCSFCGSRYVLYEEGGEIQSIDDLIREGYEYLREANYDDAYFNFETYVSECGIPNYDAYLGYILSKYECLNIEQLSEVDSCSAFECDEWKVLLSVAGGRGKALTDAIEKSIDNYRRRMKIVSARLDAECINCDELFLMYVPEYRRTNAASEIRFLMDKDSVFDTVKRYYIVPCTAVDKQADFYLPVIKDACKYGHSNIIIVLPKSNTSLKDDFIEKMFEYHMSNAISLILAYVNDIEEIKRIYRYSKNISGYYEHYDVPKAIYCDRTAYLQKNQIVLIDGNVKYANCNNSRKEQQRNKEMEVNQRAAWIREKKCRHCGGNFIGGLFTKRCCVCGKNKDY